MKNYWDLERPERAAMTEEQVKTFTSFELMRLGVVNPTEPQLMDERMPKVPTREVFVIEIDRRPLEGIAFVTRAAAEKFVNNDFLLVEHNYRAGYDDNAYYTRIPGQVAIVGRNRPDEATFQGFVTELERVKVAKETNQKLLEDHRKAVKAADEALRGLWEDWSSCRAEARKVQKIRDTYTEYLGMCNGDAKVARGFLAKVFTTVEIEGALDPLVPECHAQPPVQA